MGKGLLSVTYYGECPMCGKIEKFEIADKEINKAIEEYKQKKIYVQDIPLPPNQREFLKSGYCFECQKLIFGTE